LKRHRSHLSSDNIQAQEEESNRRRYTVRKAEGERLKGKTLPCPCRGTTLHCSIKRKIRIRAKDGKSKFIVERTTPNALQ
jgi:hypothetical protein